MFLQAIRFSDISLEIKLPHPFPGAAILGYSVLFSFFQIPVRPPGEEYADRNPEKSHDQEDDL